jgi:hypothetical protein
VRRGLFVALCAAAPLAAQERATDAGTAARSGAVFDAYFFGAGFAFRHVVEWTVPVALSQRVGSRLVLDLATAYARASAATATSGTLEISGLTDTDLRATWAAVPGHLVLVLAAALPTGRREVPASAVPLLSALATDLLGFTTSSFGSGGGVASGFATAIGLGPRWAGGVAASYRWHASYTPVAGGGTLAPGGEGRVRVGVEGPVWRGGYLRGAVTYDASGADTLNGGARSITGDRLLTSLGLNLPAGRASLGLYAYDVVRFRPRAYDSTNRNAIQVPRGNVLALGARMERSLSPALRLVPHLEFRRELAGPSTGSLALLGWLVRPGVDVRYRASAAASLVGRAEAAFGRVADTGTSVGLVGPRAVLAVEWAR